MSNDKDTTIALNVRLKPSEPSAHPRASNYTNVGVAQGIAYIDFGFIEPTLLAAIAKTAKDGQAAKRIGGRPCHPRGHGRGCTRTVTSTDSASASRTARCTATQAKSVGSVRNWKGWRYEEHA
ncbi:MAG: hypothetical protein E8D46_10705 [Nitrospira sp.]|nr:MAG: hypothetical protein E8D46_10705 [Nitrospira sp.]